MKIGENGICAVCGKPIGVGQRDEFNHGPCNEKLAALEHEERVVISGKTHKLETYKRNKSAARARRYKAGKLPSWMTDR